MMKKSIVALAIAAAMMVTPVTVFADETEAPDEVYQFSYEDIDESVYDGTWVTFVQGFDMYLPIDWNVLDVSSIDGAEDAGVTFMAQAPEANADGVNWTVAVATIPDVTVDSLEQIYDELSKDDSMSGLAYGDLNGIGAVSYSIESQNVEGVAFADDEGIMYTVSFSPMNDDDFTPYESNMLISISPSEEVETETEAE